MTFSGTHAEAAGLHAPSDQTLHAPSDHTGHDSHHDHAPPAKHVECNAFACLMAVEPLPVTARPLHPILFAIMAAALAPAIDPVHTAPDLPPPRVEG